MEKILEQDRDWDLSKYLNKLQNTKINNEMKNKAKPKATSLRFPLSCLLSATCNKTETLSSYVSGSAYNAQLFTSLPECRLVNNIYVGSSSSVWKPSLKNCFDCIALYMISEYTMHRESIQIVKTDFELFTEISILLTWHFSFRSSWPQVHLNRLISARGYKAATV